MLRKSILSLLLPFVVLTSVLADEVPGRQQTLLSSSGWQFVGVGDNEALPEIGSDAFHQAAWAAVTVPHNFQTRAAYLILTKGWYKRQVTVAASAKGKELYLVFEGAASVADVYVNGQHLGQHRGGYTRFVFDATRALHVGPDNELAVKVDDAQEDCLDCLPVPGLGGLYKVWGGLYRKVWLLETAPVHIDPTDDGAPGVYLTPQDVSADSAKLEIKALVRNTTPAEVTVEVRATVLDPAGAKIITVTTSAPVSANQRNTVNLTTSLSHPQLWAPGKGRVYHVQTDVYVAGQLQDEVMQPVGFRSIAFDWQEGHATVNGAPTILAGVDIHQETEEKGSAVADKDLTHNLDMARDVGSNFVRLSHYPRAEAEYDHCDELGLMCWAEDGNSGGPRIRNIATSTSAQIATEMVKQNYNHPSIVIWSAGNEAVAEVADQCVPIIKALDPSRPVVVANMKSTLADTRTANAYPGWYGGDMRNFKPKGFYSEIGAGGVVTIHCDYNQADWKVDRYEPEEYQQLVAENDFQKAFHGDNSHLGLFCWWILRDFTDTKYKKPVGINTKGLLTYAGDPKDVFYLYRCFLRPEAPTLWITSKRYFLRQGAANNGIKVYGTGKSVTLTLNGEKVSTLPNGHYVLPDGPWVHHPPKEKHGALPAAENPTPEATREPVRVDNVFYWPVPLRTGKNTVSVTDDQGQSDSAVIYYYGAKDQAAAPDAQLPVSGLASSNAKNPAYDMEMPIRAQWPIYTDFDSTADNSWNNIPVEVENATWISLRRVTKPDQATDVSFTTTRPLKIYVVATKMASPPALPAGFKEVAPADFRWRDNDLQLVPAQLYLHEAAAGENVKISLGDRDAIVLFKDK
jgi:beta-galactosidase